MPSTTPREFVQEYDEDRLLVARRNTAGIAGFISRCCNAAIDNIDQLKFHELLGRGTRSVIVHLLACFFFYKAKARSLRFGK
jgi:hypothetical protein